MGFTQIPKMPEELVRKLNSSNWPMPEKSDSERDYIGDLLSVLGMTSGENVSFDKDTQIIWRIAKTIVEAAEDGTLEKNEALALLEFFTGKYVQRRLSMILQDYINIDPKQKYSLKGIKGVLYGK